MKKFFAAALAATVAMLCLFAGACAPVKGDGPADDTEYADVFLFMGQSNMGGRGDKAQSVVCGEGHGFEFRAVTDPTKLYPMAEPFGENENNDRIADIRGDETKKTGSLVSAFTEAYYRETGVPIVGVSASQGGTNSEEWQPGGGLVEEAAARLRLCLDYMYSQDVYTVRHIEMVWLQGESDAGNSVSYETYSANLANVVNAMKDAGVEHCFVIQIGSYMRSERPDRYEQYQVFQALQERMCREQADMTLVSKKLAGMPESMMQLSNHYLQPAYNIVGTDAGKNTAFYMQTGKAPVCTPYAEEDGAA